MKSSIGLLLGLSISFSAFSQLALPIYKSPASISVSSASMGAWTEVAAGEYQIANSDVYLWDPSKNTSAETFIGMLLLGVPGALIGSAIKIDAGQKAASGTGAIYVKKFDQELSATVARKIETDSRKEIATIGAIDQPADIVLRPAIRFYKLSGNLSVMMVRLAAAYKDPESGKTTTREFQVVWPDQLALAGENESWAAEDGKAFKERSIEGLELAAGMFLKHLAGELRLAESERDQRRLSLKVLATGATAENVILEETESHYFTNMVSMRRVMPRVIFAVSKKAVEV